MKSLPVKQTDVQLSVSFTSSRHVTSWTQGPNSLQLLLSLECCWKGSLFVVVIVHLFTPQRWLVYLPSLSDHSVQFSHSVVSKSVTAWTSACQASLSITKSQSLLKLMSIESVRPSNHLILCQPLLPPSIIPSIKVFSNESVLHIRWPNYGSFSFSISPSIEYSGLTSFRIDWLDLLAVQGTLKSLLQHHSSKASILQC